MGSSLCGGGRVMARDRSFADYVREKLYNRIYKSVEEFVELNWERLDLDISNVHNVGEVAMSNMEIQFVSVGDLPDLKIQFDVVVDAEIGVRPVARISHLVVAERHVADDQVERLGADVFVDMNHDGGFLIGAAQDKRSSEVT